MPPLYHNQMRRTIPALVAASKSASRSRRSGAASRRPVLAHNYRVGKLFRVPLADTELSADAASVQSVINGRVNALSAPIPPLRSSNVLVAALASPMRECIVHKRAFPCAFMVRFVKAVGADGTVRA